MCILQILQGEQIPEDLLSPKTIWEERYRSIRDLEKHLYYNGTRVIKFFLHLSKEEQRQRFLKRLDDPSKNWKISPADIQERKFWKDYMKAYEACLSATSTPKSPWYIVPADDKENAHLIISQTIVDTLKSLENVLPSSRCPTPKRIASNAKSFVNGIELLFNSMTVSLFVL